MSKKEIKVMRFRLNVVEFVVCSLGDIKCLCKAWDSLWTGEDRGNNESVMVQVLVDDRVPGEEVNLRFYATTEVLDRFLSILEQAGLKFSCEDFLPGLCRVCRIDRGLDGLGTIGANEGPESN
jgi:hypothetical protein